MFIEHRIKKQVAGRELRLTLHAQQEMVNEDVTVQELLSALTGCSVVEEYPDHQRGACYLVCGQASTGRYLHTVCTTDQPLLIVITVYEPKPPKWPTPFSRRKLL
ncbi:MAG: DUF4258 domain-containing protein [Deltaproteobacteria bacterium]|nr:DUF4258 domain-containing protein [Deltaproteobacteria bacterium]